jgi:hypothetical protein
MTESVTEPKRRLALDMGWRTAAVFALFFCFCLLAAGISLWSIFTAAPVSLKISWQTFFALLMASWGAWKFEQRIARFGIGLLVLSFSSKVLLASFHAPIDMQVFNAEIMRVVNVLLLVGICVWIILWFKPRVKRV